MVLPFSDNANELVRNTPRSKGRNAVELQPGHQSAAPPSLGADAHTLGGDDLEHYIQAQDLTLEGLDQSLLVRELA